MKKYVFLTSVLTGLSGNPRYVNTKIKYLKENGWNVTAIWSFDKGILELDENKKYANNLIRELQFPPSWFNRRIRSKILKKILSIIGSADQVVIESNSIAMAVWGELAAEKIQCKHILFLTGEHNIIKKRSTFDFCFNKLQRNELFTINAPAFVKLFSFFYESDTPDKYVWSATMDVQVGDVEINKSTLFSNADFTIGIFGRYKAFFPSMIAGIEGFIKKHFRNTINIIMLGDIGSHESLLYDLQSENVKVLVHEPMEVIPRSFITDADIIFAAAGCARLAFKNGGKVITMDVNTSKPLGYFGYTTMDTNISSGKYTNDKSVEEWMESLLVKKDDYNMIGLEPIDIDKGFKYQMTFIKQQNATYYPCIDIGEMITKHDGFYRFICKVGAYKLITFLYFKRRLN